MGSWGLCAEGTPYDGRNGSLKQVQRGGSRSAAHQPPDPDCRVRGMVIVGPDDPDHAEVGDLAELVFALLLLEHDLAGILPGFEQPSVLDLAVELAEQPVLGPGP